VIAPALASWVCKSVNTFYSFKIQSPNSRKDIALKKKKEEEEEDDEEGGGSATKGYTSSGKFIIASLKHDGGVKWVRRTDASVNGQRKKSRTSLGME